MSYQLLEENLDARVENSLKISFSHFRFLFLYLRHVVLHESLADFLCQKKKKMQRKCMYMCSFSQWSGWSGWSGG